MPELDGLQTTKLIRGDLQMNMPIIGITAYAAPGEKEKCLAAGMNDYILKPVDEAELHRLLAHYLVPVAAEAQP
jgi:CheY-like chemotaxis protein